MRAAAGRWVARRSRADGCVERNVPTRVQRVGDLPAGEMDTPSAHSRSAHESVSLRVTRISSARDEWARRSDEQRRPRHCPPLGQANLEPFRPDHRLVARCEPSHQLVSSARSMAPWPRVDKPPATHSTLQAECGMHHTHAECPRLTAGKFEGMAVDNTHRRTPRSGETRFDLLGHRSAREK
jgi:hypothetical protein